jgi:chaperonin GroES
MTEHLKPLHDRVVVERIPAEEKTASGIVLPGNAAEKPDTGIVMAVGTGKQLDDGKVRSLTVKVGDKVIFGKYAGQEVKIAGKTLHVMREDDIYAIVL